MAGTTSGNFIQVKASGLMCSFCTMSVEKALGWLPGVNTVQVNLVHGIILVDADQKRVGEQEVARKIEEFGYMVVAIFATIKRRGFLAIGFAIADPLFGPLTPRARQDDHKLGAARTHRSSAARP